MREGWIEKTLGKACVVERGSSPRPIKNFVTEADDGVNWVKIGDVGEKDKYVYRTKEKITPEGAKKSRFVNVGDFILSNSMSFGRPYIMKVPGYIHDGWFVLRLKDDLDQDYFWYLLSSPFVKKQFHDLAAGAIVKNISGDLVKKAILPIPPITEQKQIVSILDKAFAAIDQAKANIERNIENAKELFQSKLNEIFSQKGEGWEEKTLPEIVSKECSLSYGIVQPGEEFPNGLPVIRPTDMKQMFVEYSDLKRINPEKAKSYKRTELTGNELLLCVRGETGGVALMTDEFKGSNVTRGIVPITFNDDILLKFGYYQFISPFIVKQIKEKTYGAALMQINIRDVKKLNVRVTSLENQIKITNLLDSLFELKERQLQYYYQKLASLEELKKSILQKAFAGELTANDAIIEDIPLAAEPEQPYT